MVRPHRGAGMRPFLYPTGARTGVTCFTPVRWTRAHRFEQIATSNGAIGDIFLPLGSCYSRPVPAILTARARGAMSAAITAERCEAGEADQAVAIARLAVSQANRSICGAMDTNPDPRRSSRRSVSRA